MIYLDNAATTYPKPECVYEALNEANRNLAFNAGRGSYPEAKQVADMIDETRSMVADLVGGNGDMVSFEASATEALNLIINGIDFKEGDTVYISPFEHNAVVRPLYNLKEKIGIEIQILPFDRKNWKVDENKLVDMFAFKKPKACFLSHISNVTGYILPTGSIFSQASRYNCINVLDCSQSLGIVKPNVDDVDFVVFAGHKSLYASFGIAGFINLKHRKLSITKSGGTGADSLNPYMPKSGYQRYESGSSNGPAIAGLNQSLKWLKTADVYNHEKELTEYLVDKLSAVDNVTLFVPEDNKVFGIVSLQVEGYSAADIGAILSDEFGICVRTGYHCAPFVHEFIGSLDCGGTVRISFGAFTKTSDLDQLIAALEQI